MVGRAAHAFRPAFRAYGLAALVVIIDQLMKQWIAVGVLGLEEGRSVELSPLIDLTFHFNSGMVFGLAQGGQVGRWLMIAVALSFTGAMAVWIWTARSPRRLLYVGLLMGGAIGNMIDRLRWGAVADFIDATDLFFPWIFNVADMAITLAAAVLFIDVLLGATPRPAKEKAL